MATTTTAYSTNQRNLLPFVGRDDLLQELSIVGDDAKLGHGVTVLIQGEGGMLSHRLHRISCPYHVGTASIMFKNRLENPARHTLMITQNIGFVDMFSPAKIFSCKKGT
jgi:hypothetical protein